MKDEELKKWSAETDRKKKKLAAQLKAELGDVITSEDENIIDKWAFELNI